MQAAAILGPMVSIQMELRPADELLLHGVPWGRVDAFPAPAYRTYQARASS